MTNNEEIRTCIEHLRLLKAEIEWDKPIWYQCDIDLAIKAIEKQIPKKPKEKHRLGGIDKYVYGHCATCSEPINYEFQYCLICGQKADWSDEE